MRMAVARAYGVPYADTPALDPLKADPPDPVNGKPGEQQRVWEAWAAEHGLRWWFSNELAPIGCSRWIAAVPSRMRSDYWHAVVMEFDRLLFDPMEGGEHAWTEVRQLDVLSARMLLPVDSPIWQQEIRYWRIRPATQ